MAYNNNIPQPTDNLSVSQGQLLGNFQSLDNIFAFDHFTFDDQTAGGVYQGFHKQITFPVPRSMDPVSPVSGVVYTKLISAVPQLFFENSALAITQLTGLPQNIANPGSYTFAGGLTIKWGTYTMANTVGTVSVVFAGSFVSSIFALLFGSNVSGSPNNLPIYQDGTLDLTGFTAARVNGSSGGTYTYFYCAIGK